MEILNKRMKELRIDKGLSQNQIADFLDISMRSYQRYEYGQREPDPSTLVKLAKYYNVSTDYLLGLSNSPKPYH